MRGAAPEIRWRQVLLHQSSSSSSCTRCANVDGGFHGRGTPHVDAGVAEQVERILRAAGFEEAQVIVQFLRSAGEHPLG